MKLLLAEDEQETGRYLVHALQEAGHVTNWVEDGETAYAFATSAPYDVIVLDRMLPKRDGLRVLKDLRAESITTPVLLLSALAQVEDRVEGLRAGADDYLSKPFSFAELLARLEVLQKRTAPEAYEKVYRVADLELDRLTHTVQRAGQKILLQPREFRLLEYLMRYAGQVVTRTMLLENVWNYHFDPQTNVVDVHISRLRAKITKTGEKPLLHTVRGVGYMLKEEAYE